MSERILIYLMLLPQIIFAQNNEVWADLNVYKSISDKVTVFGDAGSRAKVDGQAAASFYIRPSASYQLSKNIMISGGAAWFYAHPKEEGSANEARGWQGIRVEQRVLNRVMLNNFTRLEERNFFKEGATEFLLRFRTLFGASVLINQSTLQEGTWYIPLAFEIFEDINDHQKMFFNRRRFYSGVGYAINSQTRAELFYIANESRPDQEVDFETVNVIRLRIHVTFPERAALTN
ncbi:MAG: DUF2490 domain-containing protein [Cyclobacteriaceae bacterium]